MVRLGLFPPLKMLKAVLFLGDIKSQQNSLDVTQLTPDMGYEKSVTYVKSLNSAGTFFSSFFKTGWKKFGAIAESSSMIFNNGGCLTGSYW